MLKYEEIAIDLQNKIANREYNVNDQLPLEKEMCEEYGVSRITIKKAVDILVMKGLVVKRRGAGTFVKGIESSEIKEISESNLLTGFTGNFAEKKVTSKVIEFNIINTTSEIANKLKISNDEFVYYICRVRYANDEPYVIEYTYMPINVITGLKKDVLEKSIYNYIEETLNLKIKSAHRTIRAVSANEEERKYLEIEKYSPLLEVEQIAFLDNGIPFEYSKSHHRNDKFEFKSVIIK
ncbi:GntR family transcriptional regulator [Clostridium celatum]|uniref:GntR family transcriptional regulator n=1 Tax=Clostridium celatum TaxID=36834 RepID=UPI001F22FE23|nr:GntR family transcriptional regulator [Clostridium celatum]MCE9654094.1 GntR family transcriptional regulator [Clostridium celatum]MDU2266252.1 GntR family transcriptional regulator [Clostridium celatum]MDU6296516.1 GntR family transcriptional regulator [Clostridium celatum]